MLDSREYNRRSILFFPFFSTAEHTCTLPFAKYHEGCYLKVNQKMTRDAAQAYCQTQQSSVLALVESAGQNSWLSDQVTTDSWIGYKLIGSYIPPGSSYTQLQYQNSMGEIVSCIATIVCFPFEKTPFFCFGKRRVGVRFRLGQDPMKTFATTSPPPTPQIHGSARSWRASTVSIPLRIQHRVLTADDGTGVVRDV